MIYGYIRVSTDMQDTEGQKLGIIDKANSLEIQIDAWISDDGVSGSKEPEDRLLGKLLKKIKTDDVIIASEISRLGRKLFMVMRILEHCMKVGAKVYTVKDGYELGDNIQSKVLAFAFGLAAEIERDMISKRTKEGLQRRRNEGQVLGRPMGVTCKKKLNDKEVQIKKYLSANLSYSAIARLLKCHRLTVSSICKEKGWKQKDHKVSVRTNPPEHIRVFQVKSNDKLNIGLKELLRKFEQNGFSLTKMAADIDVTVSSLSTFLKNNGFYEKFQEASQAQRMKVKSKNQLEREGLIPTYIKH